MNVRRSYIILDILAAAAFAGVYFLKEFARTKLGFVRWLNFNGNKLIESIPYDKVKYIMLAVILLVALLALAAAFRRKAAKGINGTIMCVVLIAASLYYVYATIAFDYAYSQAFFLMIPAAGAGTLLLAIRNLIPPVSSAG